jgi:hypothetical protein
LLRKIDTVRMRVSPSLMVAYARHMLKLFAYSASSGPTGTIPVGLMRRWLS